MQLIITTAGFAAIVNANNTGTGPVLVAQIGITDQVFTADAGDLTLPGEIKRLTTFAGAAVADDTIHVTIRDDSADVYTMRGFGLYAADGTLLALYSQAGAILEKSAQAMMLLAADCIFSQIEATSLTFGDTNWINPPGTESVPGVLELATDAETATGTDDTRAVHPKGLKALLDSRFGIGAPSAFVKGLLTIATATLMRAALELKSAALKDEGAGNGLDADLLDGQHGAYYRSYANLTGVPTSFPPSAHSHLWANISDPPSTATRWPTFDEVTGKPVAYPPSAHTHAAADITSGTFADARIPALAIAKTTGLQAALDAKADLASAQTFTGYKTFAAGVGGSEGGEFAMAKPASGTALTGNVNVDIQGNSLRVYGGNGTASGLGGVQWDVFDKNGIMTGWHSGNFNPASKADTGHTHGNTYVANDTPVNGVGLGWVNGNIRVRVDVSTWNLWHTGNFDPGTKASLNANVSFGDVTASRGNGTGVIFLGGGTRYLYYNGGGYEMPGAGLVVGGTVSAPAFAQSSSRRYKRDIETISAEEALELLAAVRLVRYTMRADGSAAMGVIAEELADGPLDFAVTRTENGDPEGVNYQPLFVLACSALQGLAGRVAALEARG